MIKVKINKKYLAVLLSTGVVFSLSACCDEKDKNSTNLEGIVYENSSESEAFNLDSPIISNDDISSKEEEFDYFSSSLGEAEVMIEEENFDLLKNKVKEVFITGVDFIFFDKEIKGVKFSELTEEGKEITISNLSYLGDMVQEVIPGWREELSDKYRVASDFVSDIYLSSLDKIRNYLGDENYEALGNIKDQILGDIHGAYDNAKEHVKSWYFKFRSEQ